MNEISFSYEKMGTKTRFEEEAKGNSEMPYCIWERGECTCTFKHKEEHKSHLGGQQYLYNYIITHLSRTPCVLGPKGIVISSIFASSQHFLEC